MTSRLQHLDSRMLRYNLYLSQGIVLVVAALCSLWLYGWDKTRLLFAFPSSIEYIFAIFTAGIIVIFSIASDRFLPSRWQDDGDINRRIFLGISFWPTLFVCFIVGVSEEWLFRGLLQNYFSNLGTSAFFTLIHFRYLRMPFLLISVFFTSLLLGGLFSLSHHLWTPIIAHTLIDFVQARYLQAIDNKERRTI